MRLRVLGPLAVTVDGNEITLRSAKQRIMLATLVSNANNPVSPQLLIEALWEVPPASAADNLRLYVHQLRRALGDRHGISRTPGGYVVAVDPADLDAEVFAELVAQGGAALSRGEPDKAAGALADALALWRGPAYGELAESPGLRLAAVSLEEARLRATELRIESDLLLGRHGELVPELTVLAERHPFRERVQAQLMRALHRCGRPADALEVYRRGRALMVEELGMEPGAELRALHAAVLRGDEPGPTETVVAVANHAPNPYLGLISYQREHRSMYFGRTELVRRAVEMARTHPVMAVFGASGSGKSSLLRAGLVGTLAEDPGWRTVVLTPTARPLEALAAAGELTADDGSLLVVVDQFEELFTLCADPEERDRFVAALLAAANTSGGRTTVVLGVRADFLPQLTERAELLAALGDGAMLLVGPPTRDDLREIITRPAQRAGVTVDPDLVATLLTDIGAEAGALPLLSHTLRQTWHNRAGGSLSSAAYRASGGLHGAVARTAERLYAAHGADEQPVIRKVLLRLTSLGEGTDDTRRPITRAELDGIAAPDTVDRVLAALAAERLIVIDEDTIAVAHEAVIRAWPRLRRWLTEDRGDLLVHRRLTVAAQTWKDLDEDPDALYRGAQLLTAGAWADRHDSECNETERAFLAASREHADRAVLAERRRTRVLKRMVTALAAVLVVAVVAAGVAVWKGRQASAGETIELAHRVAGTSTGMIDDAPDLAGLLAIEAHRLHQDPDTLGALLSAASAAQRRIDLNVGGSPVHGIAISPDGSTVASADGDGVVSLWDLATRTPVARLTEHSVLRPESEARKVVFGDGGRLLASIGRAAIIGPGPGAVVVWDTATKAPLFQRRFDSITHALAFDRAGRTIAVGLGDGSIELWDVRTNTKRVLPGDGNPAVSLTFSPAGTQLVSATRVSRPVVWDLVAGAAVGAIPADSVESVAFDPRRGTLVTASRVKGIRSWRLDGGTAVMVAELPARAPLAWDISTPIDDRLAVVDENGLVTLWDLGRGQILAAYQDRGRTEARSLALGEDGTTLVSAGFGRTIAVRRGAVAPFDGHGDAVSSMAVNPAGTVIATGGYDRTVRLWTPDGKQTALFDAAPGIDRVEAVAFDPTGGRLAALGRNHTITVWDVASGRVVRSTTFAGLGASTDLAYAPDGGSIAAASSIRFRFDLPELTARPFPRPAPAATMLAYLPDGSLVSADTAGTVLVWDTKSDKKQSVIDTGQGSLNGIAVTRDGTRVATAGADRTTRVWDLATGAELTRVHCAVSAANKPTFSADGHTLAVACADRTISLWSVPTGRRITTLTGHTGQVRALAFLPDGTLVSGGEDRRIIRWTLTADDAHHRICSDVNRDLSPDEWRDHLGDGEPERRCR